MVSALWRPSLSLALQAARGVKGWEDARMRRNLNLLILSKGTSSFRESKLVYPEPSTQVSVCQAKETASTGLVLLAEIARDGQESVDQNERPSFFLLESGLRTPNCFIGGSAF